MTECARHEGHVYNLCTSASLCSIIISVCIYICMFFYATVSCVWYRHALTTNFRRPSEMPCRIVITVFYSSASKQQ